MLTGVPPSQLEIAGPATGLLDDPLVLRARGAGPDAPLAWRARHRDDADRVWRATAPRAEELGAAWATSAREPGIAALGSLRPLRIDVRVEAPFAAGIRTVVRSLAGEGVRRRRWRDGLAAALHLPARPDPCACVLVDATRDAAVLAVAALAAPLLASRGALVLVAGPPPRRGDPADALAQARGRLEALPAVAEVIALPARNPLDPDPREAPGTAVGLPPGVGVHGAARDAADRARDWDALLARLGAAPRLSSV
jgi:hypothetical protein